MYFCESDSSRAARLLLILLGGIAAGLILAFSIVGGGNFDTGSMGAGQDSRAYWHALRATSTYGRDAGTYGAYLYSPAFTQLLSPLLALPWQPFLAAWALSLVGALLLLSGRALFVLVLPIAFFELWGGNVHLLLALAIVAGFRWPQAWAFVLLTKVTPGIGLLWFAARREWRSLAVALFATALVVAVSWLIQPALWTAWIDLLLRDAGMSPPPGSVGIHIGLRLPIAALLIMYAAHTNRRWLVPLGALLAMPVLWWGSFSILIAVVALERDRLEQVAVRAIGRFDERRRPRQAVGEWVAEPEG
jgi:hypothetical protein